MWFIYLTKYIIKQPPDDAPETKKKKKIQNKDSKFISCMIVKRAEKTF